MAGGAAATACNTLQCRSNVISNSNGGIDMASAKPSGVTYVSRWQWRINNDVAKPYVLAPL